MTPGSTPAIGRGGLSLPLLLLALLWPFCAVAVASSNGAATGAPYLIVEREDGTVLTQLSLATEDTWILRWNHSVSGIEVSDYYAYERGSMVLTDSHTPAFDAGLGHIPGRGRLESDGRGGYWIRDIDEVVRGNRYILRVGAPAVNHRIVHDGATISLSDLAAGERVVIRVSSP